jgi:ubiquinone/menaquinone biosynthesis C-methylase UbiE
LNIIESYYNKKSVDYDKVFDTLYFRVYDEITWRYLEPYVPSNSDALVLDAGGGTGRWALRMARKGCKVFLLEISEGMLNIAKKLIEKEKLQNRIITEKGDCRALRHADKTFDLVFCEHALFLFNEPDAAVNEFARVLKKQAPLVISAHNLYVQLLLHLPSTEMPMPEKLDEVLHLLLHEKYDVMTKDSDSPRIYTWTPQEFRSLLERNGFSVEKIVGKGVTMPSRFREEVFMKREYPDDLFRKILQLELVLCEKPDALALAGHMQAIAYKQ